MFKRSLLALLGALLFAVSAHADTRISFTGNRAVIWNNVPTTALTNTNIFVMAVPDPGNNMILSIMASNGPSGFSTSVFNVYCSYNPFAPDYSSNTSNFIPVAVQGAGIVSLSTGTNISAGVNGAVFPLGRLGCAQVAIKIAMTSLPGVNLSAFVTFTSIESFTSTANSIIFGAPWSGAGPNYTNSGGGGVAPPAGPIMYALSPSNQFLPLTLDSMQKLQVDTGSGGNSTAGVLPSTIMNDSIGYSAFTDDTGGGGHGLAVAIATSSGDCEASCVNPISSGGSIGNISFTRNAAEFFTFEINSGTSLPANFWTVHSFNKLRLLGYRIDVTADATLASAADLIINLQDVSAVPASTDLPFVLECALPVTATVGSALPNCTTGNVNLGGFGYLSSHGGGSLAVNTSAALTAGHIRVTVWGTEE